MRHKLLVVLTGIFLGSATPSFAGVILTAPESRIFNFDITSLAPLVSVKIYFNLSDFDDLGADVVAIRVFNSHGGTGEAIPETFGGGAEALASGDPIVLDGIFSLRVQSVKGTFGIAPEAVSQGLDANGQIIESRRLGPLTVPEPGSLALLGLGLAGLGALRRKRS